MKFVAALAALALTATAAFAEDAPAAAQAEQAEVTFTVLEADARLAFSNRVIRSYRVADDDSLIFNVGSNRYYRATVWEPCRRDLRWEDAIGFDPGPGDTLDRFSHVVVRGNRCPIQTFDRIEEPAPDASR